MTCNDCLENLGPFVDGELPADEAAVVEEHLKTCPDCAAAHRRLMGTSSRLKAGLMRYEAPDVLKARIRASLAGTAPEAGPQRVPVRLFRNFSWGQTIAAAAAVAIVSSALTLSVANRPTSGDPVQQEVLASHIRSLIPGHLTDVSSTDQHNVKPWFNGRVNVSPDVPKLDSLGFPLIGGRLDYLQGRNVPVVVYTRRQHIINVFSWPATDARDLTPSASSSNGYHLIRSRQKGMEVWVVSDLNLAELEEFARILKQSR